jgi:hypothetical protein
MIPVPYRQQEGEFTYVLACVRMLFEFHGIVEDETVLSERRKQFEQGTYIGDLKRLADWWTELTVEITFPGDESCLRGCLDAGDPVIVYLDTASLPYWTYPAHHAVVVVGADAVMFYLHDPRHPTGEPVEPRAVPRDEFLTAWTAVGNPTALIRHAQAE